MFDRLPEIRLFAYIWLQMQTHDSKDLTVFMLDMILQKEEIILLHC